MALLYLFLADVRAPARISESVFLWLIKARSRLISPILRTQAARQLQKEMADIRQMFSNPKKKIKIDTYVTSLAESSLIRPTISPTSQSPQPIQLELIPADECDDLPHDVIDNESVADLDLEVSRTILFHF